VGAGGGKKEEEDLSPAVPHLGPIAIKMRLNVNDSPQKILTENSLKSNKVGVPSTVMKHREQLAGPRRRRRNNRMRTRA